MTSVDAQTLASILDEINTFGALENGGSERLAWSPDEIAARTFLADRCRNEGFQTEIDAAGNVWAFTGTRPAVVLGSHLDTVPDGGRFDGALGIASALACLIAASNEGHSNLGLVCFTDEEGVRFGVGMTGSRALAGTLTTEEIELRSDRDGVRLSRAMHDGGADPEHIDDVPARARDVTAFMEVHIEQGRRLERAALPASIVTSIVGISHWQITVAGEPNHAGTTFAEDRHDAFLPVATAALVADEVMRSTEGLVATVGEAFVQGGAQNIVPGIARMSLDVRAEDDETIQEAVDQIRGALQEAADRCGCRVEATETKRLHPAPMSDNVRQALRDSAIALEIEAPEMPSMAGHDAMNLSGAGIPCGMIFVRSKEGISHSPREFSTIEDCVTGANLMLDAALRLSAS
jgi:allantoate deiminase